MVICPATNGQSPILFQLQWPRRSTRVFCQDDQVVSMLNRGILSSTMTCPIADHIATT